MSAKVRYGPVQLVLDVPDNEVLPVWAANPHKQQVASVVFFDANGGQPVETLRLPGAYCISYHEQFNSSDVSGGAYQCTLTLSDPTGWTIQAGGPLRAYVALAARSYAGVAGAVGIGGAMAAAAVAAPFVAGVDGVPRLPLIKGDPPFTVKGPKKGKNGKPDKDGLDLAEFARQLKGQQEGLNRLTVAEFIAHRDHYDKLRKQTGNGRDPKGDAAQKVEREKALERKVQELQLADDNLTESDAIVQAKDWMKTQAALHDPDQIAGGHADRITGMGDSRVNSSIGSQWVKHKRIDKIDQQIRAHAANMTQDQMENTLLDVKLSIA